MTMEVPRIWAVEEPMAMDTGRTGESRGKSKVRPAAGGIEFRVGIGAGVCEEDEREQQGRAEFTAHRPS